jgi:clathrin coat assembly protein AP180
VQAGGLDLLTLDSLYDEANRRASQPASYNPWDATAPAPMMITMAPAMHDPFYASNGYAAPHGVQMAAMAHQQQQQQVFMLQQQMMAPAPAVHHPMQMQQNPANPFGNPFAAAGAHPYGAAGMPLHAGPGNVYTGLI